MTSLTKEQRDAIRRTYARYERLRTAGDPSWAAACEDLDEAARGAVIPLLDEVDRHGGIVSSLKATIESYRRTEDAAVRAATNGVQITNNQLKRELRAAETAALEWKGKNEILILENERLGVELAGLRDDTLALEQRLDKARGALRMLVGPTIPPSWQWDHARAVLAELDGVADGGAPICPKCEQPMTTKELGGFGCRRCP